MKIRKTKQDKLKTTLKGILGDGPIQFEITKDGMSVRNDKGGQIFALKGKVRVETKLRECERCNSVGRKKELEALGNDRKELEAKDNKLRDLERRLDERTKAVIENEEKLKVREKEIKGALKTLCKE